MENKNKTELLSIREDLVSMYEKLKSIVPAGRHQKESINASLNSLKSSISALDDFIHITVGIYESTD